MHRNHDQKHSPFGHGQESAGRIAEVAGEKTNLQ